MAKDQISKKKTQWFKSLNGTRIWTPLLSVLVLSVTIITMQNCGDVRLRTNPVTEVTQAASSEVVSYKDFPTPERLVRPTRILFLVDQSWSMANAPCPGDLDYLNAAGTPEPRDNPTPCTPENGSDGEGIRYKAIENMLKTLPKDHPDLKVAFVPFSGSLWQQRPNTYYDNAGFYTLNSAQTDNTAPLGRLREERPPGQLAVLKAEHTRTRGQRPGSNPLGADNFVAMFSTSLHHGLEETRKQLEKDMTAQATAGKLRDTRYAVVILTDGLMRPKWSHIVDAMGFMGGGGCVNTSVCQSETNCRSMLSETIPPGPDYRECPGKWGQVFSTFGDSRDNRMERLVLDILSLKSIARIKGAAPITFKVLRVNPNNLSAPRKAESLAFFESLKSKTSLSYSDLTSGDQVPFNLGGLAGTTVPKTLRLRQLFVRNLNFTTDEVGQIHVDSDGDGLPDTKDPKPLAAREVGKCLDSFTVGDQPRGCLLDAALCKSTVDTDGDGLSDCEERTLNSDTTLIDTDSDMIPDSLDLLFGGAPLIDEDTYDSSGEGQSNMVNFTQGLSATSNLNFVPQANKTLLKITEGPWTTRTNRDGDTVRTPSYSIKILQIPLVRTQAASGLEGLFPHQTITIPRDASEIFGPTSHAVGINQILVFGQLQALEDPTATTWMILKLEVPYGTQEIAVDPSQFKILGDVR